MTVSLISCNVTLITRKPMATHCTGAANVNHRLLAVCRWRCSTCCSSPARTAPRRATWCTARTVHEPRVQRWLEWWCWNSIALKNWWGPTTASRWSVALFFFLPISSSWNPLCIEVASVHQHEVAVSCIFPSSHAIQHNVQYSTLQSPYTAT